MENFKYTVKKSSRAKHVRLSVSNEGIVTVTLPTYAPLREAHNFVREKTDWVFNILKKLSPKAGDELRTGSKIKFMGGELVLYIREKDRSHAKAEIVGDSIIVFLPGTIDGKIRDSIVKQAIKSCFIKEFRKIISETIENYNKFYKFKFNRIAIKDNKTNWGSCSSQRNLNFNWRLIFAPLDIISYVVVHELCHLVEPNHSEKYWEWVSMKFPDYSEKRRWLRENGANLKI